MLQCAMFAAAWPLTARSEALYDPNMFEGDIEITLDELIRFYGGPLMDEPGQVSVTSQLSEFLAFHIMHCA